MAAREAALQSKKKKKTYLVRLLAPAVEEKNYLVNTPVPIMYRITLEILEFKSVVVPLLLSR